MLAGYGPQRGNWIRRPYNAGFGVVALEYFLNRGDRKYKI